jgi:hypothetical protein
MKISQSIIKEVLKYGLCPRLFKEKYLDNSYEDSPSMAMFRGIYFEYVLLGNLPRSGKVPVYPVGKRGKHEIHKSRIDKQIKNFPKIMKKEGIEIIGGVQEIEWKYSPAITLTLTLDSIALYKGKLYVADLKLTQDINSTFGDICWGSYDQMDKLQAHLYAYVMSQVMGEEVGFIYMVFDYKKSAQEYLIVEETLTKAKKNEMFDRIAKAEQKINWMRQTQFRPRAYEKTCKNCSIQDCVARFKPEAVPVEEAFVKPENAVKVNIDDLISIMTE